MKLQDFLLTFCQNKEHSKMFPWALEEEIARNPKKST